METSLKVWYIRMWEKGHSLDELRSMSMDDFGDIIGYWSEKERAEQKLAEQRRKK